jgi:hypothetical protein
MGVHGIGCKLHFAVILNSFNTELWYMQEMSLYFCSTFKSLFESNFIDIHNCSESIENKVLIEYLRLRDRK